MTAAKMFKLPVGRHKILKYNFFIGISTKDY